METKQEVKTAKSKPGQSLIAPVRVKRETKKRLLAELVRVNKKSFGRKVRVDVLILRALDCLRDSDISALQEASLSNADRLEISYREFAKTKGSLTKDEFIGKLLTGEIKSEINAVSAKPQGNLA